MKKIVSIMALMLLGTATTRADEELPMPKRETVLVPNAVAPSGPCGFFPYWRQRLDDWLMFEPLYHPHLCSTCGPKAVCSCEPPLYTFFLTNCPATAAPCHLGHTSVVAPSPALPPEHPIRTFWQRRICCVKNCLANTVTDIKMSATCPNCGKTIYFALWSTHQCQNTAGEPQVKTDTSDCTSGGCGHKRPWFAITPCSECAKAKEATVTSRSGASAQ
jgi:hypothetical protein